MLLAVPMTSVGGGTDRRVVAGIDSSTQSCKVVVRDAGTGELLRIGRAKHPDGTEIDPARWWQALEEAVADAGGLDDVDALAVGAQQHGSVLLDESGEVVRPALLWNDGRSAPAAEALTAELGGPKAWADQVGSVLVASLTITKLRWIAEHEPENVARTAAVCLPHDWLTWKLAGGQGARLVTDRGDASGTGYWSPAEGATAGTCCSPPSAPRRTCRTSWGRRSPRASAPALSPGAP